MTSESRLRLLILSSLLTLGTCTNITLLSVCGTYWQSRRKMESAEKVCDTLHAQQGTERPWYAQRTLSSLDEDRTECGDTLRAEYDSLKALWKLNRAEILDCIRMETDSGQEVPREKTHYCEVYMGEQVEEKTEKTNKCWLQVKRHSVRTAALKQCCEPAGRCETAARHSQSGKTMTALRDEIAIKLAGCKSQRAAEGRPVSESRRVPVRSSSSSLSSSLSSSSSSSSSSFSSSLPSPPSAPTAPHRQSNQRRAEQNFGQNSLRTCFAYLQCEREFLEFRHRCNAVRGIPRGGKSYAWSISYMHTTPVDSRDEKCRSVNGAKYQAIVEKQHKAEAHLTDCVQHVNVTMEMLSRPPMPCDPASIPSDVDLSSASPTDCAQLISSKRDRCQMLRECCVQADVCERGSVYGVLADDYLISVFDLRDKMNLCYHN